MKSLILIFIIKVLKHLARLMSEPQKFLAHSFFATQYWNQAYNLTAIRDYGRDG